MNTPETDVPQPTSVPQPTYAHKWRAYTAIAISLTTMVMSFQMTFIALSAIADEYGVTLRAVTWVVIVQALTIGALILPMGRLADIVGRKKVHMSGLVLFAGGAILFAFSPTFGILIVARIIMAIGNSMGQSVGTAMIISAFPTKERGKAIGGQTTAVAVGASIGPVMAGLILQWFPWETLFLLLVIPISIAFIAGYFMLDEEEVGRGRNADHPRFDFVGAFLSAAVMALLVVTINNPLGAGWLSPVIVGGFSGVVVLVAGFIAWELRSSDPMIELRMFKNRVFSLGIATRVLGFMGMTATRFMLPIFLISFRGLAEGTAGLVLFLSALGIGAAAQSSGRLSDKYGERPFLIFGLFVLSGTAVAFAFVDGVTPMWIVMAIVFVNGLAVGLWNVPNMSVIVSSVPPSRVSVVSALINLARIFGLVTGQAVASAVVVGVMVSRGFEIQLNEIADTPGAGDAFVEGWRAAYILITVFSSLALLLAIFTKPGRRSEDEDAQTSSAEVPG